MSHQASLEQILDFLNQPLLNANEVAKAESIFNNLISHCEPVQNTEPYKKATLARSTYEHAQSKDIFLYQFFIFLDNNEHPDEPPDLTRGISRFSRFGPTAPASQKNEVEKAISLFGEYLFANFFSPLKASGRRTPQPTPATLSAPVGNLTGTPARLSSLRRDCLIRDHHRCVVSRAFDRPEASKRTGRDGPNAKDDDGQQLVSVSGRFASLEVAHIIPHSLMSTASSGDTSELSESKRSALAILRMFDPSAVHLIEGSEIDRPTNAITLTHDIHELFGDFKFYFEEMDPTVNPNYTYRIDSREVYSFNRPEGLPMTRTLLLSPNHTIDPPSSRLLGIHRAISIILHLSGAGEYIDRIIRDMEDVHVRSDGSTELSHIVTLKLGGWFDGVTA
ncbi:hypothetical protein FQN49_004046 [Arthroderma sp. PD_2]|nr:hypothetical protein FQN49_004046 [Arthroderma sp. PD_2]